MVKKFNRKQLVEQCGFSEDDAKVILDYQKKLPILVENENEAFIDARVLWEELGVKKKYTDWIANQIDILDLHENIDYYLFSLQSEIGNSGNFRTDTGYKIKILAAKEIAMTAGIKGGRTSEELFKKSRLARRYFILMEEAVKRMFAWELIRYPLKEGYKRMQNALDEYMIRKVQKNADDWDYKVEADALNIICCGFKAKEIRLFLGCRDNITRDHLTSTYNEYLLKLQE